MASGGKGDQLGEDWSDTEEKTHEIVLQDTEITEQEEIVRVETGARKTGAVWGAQDSSETVTEEVKSGNRRLMKRSEKLPPKKTEFDFPSIGIEVEKTAAKSESKQAEEKKASNNRYEELDVAEEEQKVEENKKKPQGKKKKKKKDWVKVDLNVKLATTVEESTTANFFQAEQPKPVERVEKPQYESRNFQIKPSGPGFRNFDIKQETGPAPASKFGSGFNRRPEVAENKTADSQAKPAGWRVDDKAKVEVQTNPPGERKKFFNSNKAGVKESIDPLQPKPKEPESAKNDVWGDRIKEQPKRKNAWGLNN